jgi:uncharacterized membrane protein YqiK
VAAALRSAGEAHTAELDAQRQRAEALEQAAQQAGAELAGLQERRVREMGQLEARFGALLATKDGTIASLAQQLRELEAALA